VTDWTAEAIRERVAEVSYWHYAFDLGHGIVTPPGHGDVVRQKQRHAYLFPPLLSLTDGSLDGLTVLDLGSNQGFWSIEAARAGASSVLGVEGRAEHVAAARFVADVLDAPNVEFETLNVFSPELAERGPFDVVFCLGLLYHVDRPLELLERLARLTRRWLVVDTSVVDVNAAVLHLIFEDPDDPRNAVGDGLVAVPSRQAVERMLWHVVFEAVWQLPQAGKPLPAAYVQGRRNAWIAARSRDLAPETVDSALLRAVPSNKKRRQQHDLLNPLAAESLGRLVQEKLRQFSYSKIKG